MNKKTIKFNEDKFIKEELLNYTMSMTKSFINLINNIEKYYIRKDKKEEMIKFLKNS